MKSFKILGGNAYIVELQDDSRLFEILRMYHGEFRGCDRLRWSYPMQGQKWLETGEISLPSGNWQIVGRLSGVTEEQAVGLVEGGKIPFDESKGAYRDYTYKSDWGAVWLSTAIESLESAIMSEGWYFENPFYKGKYPVEPTGFIKAGYCENDLVDERYSDHIHNEVQSRVISRDRAILLIRNGAQS